MCRCRWQRPFQYGLCPPTAARQPKAPAATAHQQVLTCVVRHSSSGLCSGPLTLHMLTCPLLRHWPVRHHAGCTSALTSTQQQTTPAWASRRPCQDPAQLWTSQTATCHVRRLLSTLTCQLSAPSFSCQERVPSVSPTRTAPTSQNSSMKYSKRSSRQQLRACRSSRQQLSSSSKHSSRLRRNRKLSRRDLCRQARGALQCRPPTCGHCRLVL